MEQIKFEVAKTIGNLDANFAELNKAVTERVKHYKGLVYSEDQITEAKADLASLRSDRKKIDDARKDVKNEFMKPYLTFEEKVKKTLGIYDSAISEIDAQVKDAEEKQRAQKYMEIDRWWDLNGVKSISGIGLDKVWDKAYLNKTCTAKKWQADLTEKVNKIEADLKTISFLDPEMMNFVLPIYKETLNLAEATASYERFKENQKATELARQEMERKRAERAKEQPVQPKAEEVKPTIVEEPKVAETAQKSTYWQISFTVKGNEQIIRKLSNILRELKAEGLWFKVTEKNSWEE